MRVIPPEIDSLIWRIADNADPNVVSEFSSRYPAYRAELMRRISTVKALRDSNGPRPSAVPAFVYPSKPAPAWPKWTAFGVALAAIGMTSYLVTIRATEAVPTSKTETSAPRDTDLSNRPHRTINANDDLHVGNGLRHRTPDVAVPAKPMEVPKPSNQLKETAADTAPQSFHVEKASLQTVIRAIAESGHLSVEFGPGMPDPEIGVDYDGQPVTAVLDDLGRQYKFTVFDEGAGKVLVVPEVDHMTGMGGYHRDASTPSSP